MSLVLSHLIKNNDYEELSGFYAKCLFQQPLIGWTTCNALCYWWTPKPLFNMMGPMDKK